MKEENLDEKVPVRAYIIMKDLNISVGVSDFTEIRKNGYYYIDKSEFIKDT